MNCQYFFQKVICNVMQYIFGKVICNVINYIWFKKKVLFNSMQAPSYSYCVPGRRDTRAGGPCLTFWAGRRTCCCSTPSTWPTSDLCNDSKQCRHVTVKMGQNWLLPGMQEPCRDPVRSPSAPLVGLWIAGVVEVHSELPLPAEERHVSGVDDDDVVAALVGRVVDGLALALEHRRDGLGRVERVLPPRVVKPPLAGEGAPLLHALEPGHARDFTASHKYRFQL